MYYYYCNRRPRIRADDSNGDHTTWTELRTISYEQLNINIVVVREIVVVARGSGRVRRVKLDRNDWYRRREPELPSPLAPSAPATRPHRPLPTGPTATPPHRRHRKRRRRRRQSCPRTIIRQPMLFRTHRHAAEIRNRPPPLAISADGDDDVRFSLRREVRGSTTWPTTSAHRIILLLLLLCGYGGKTQTAAATARQTDAFISPRPRGSQAGSRLLLSHITG